MRRVLLILSVVALVAAATVTGAFAAKQMVTAPPVQGSKLSVVISADTVTGGGNPAPTNTCAQTNFFRRGQLVVFRMWGVNVKRDGIALTAKNVLSALVIIPGQKPVVLAYGAHPPGAVHPVSYWDASWLVPKTYTLGVVNFRIVVKTKRTMTRPSLTGKFSQNGFAPSSRLTVTI